MLKVLICGENSTRASQAEAACRRKGIEVFRLLRCEKSEVLALQNRGVSGAMLATATPDEWMEWLRAAGFKGVIFY